MELLRTAAAVAGLEVGFLLVMPTRAAHALAWLRELSDDEASPLKLLRAKEYTAVPGSFASRLFFSGGAGGQKKAEKRLVEAATKGR